MPSWIYHDVIKVYPYPVHSDLTSIALGRDSCCDRRCACCVCRIF